MKRFSESGHRMAALAVLMILLAAGAGPAALAGSQEEDDGNLVLLDKTNRPLGLENPDKALVYVVRPATMGFAVKSYFFCDQEILGINKGNSYFFVYVEPGRHLFWSKSENVDAVELEVEAGKTYYLQQKVRMGWGKARTKLEVLNPSQGPGRVAECKKHATMTDKGRERGAGFAESHFEAAQRSVEKKDDKAAKDRS